VQIIARERATDAASALNLVCGGLVSAEAALPITGLSESSVLALPLIAAANAMRLLPWVRDCTLVRDSVWPRELAAARSSRRIAGLFRE
jgi:hypothetical protein